MELDRARARLATDPDGASELLTRAHEESKRATGELRDLVRGIHPSVLADRGLDAAVSGLAERCPVPVDVDVALDERPPGAVETGAYYVVAEALTNVGKHAGATGAIVDMGLTSASSIQLGTTAGDLHASGLAAPSVKLSTGVGGLTASLARPARILTASTVAGGMTLTCRTRPTSSTPTRASGTSRTRRFSSTPPRPARSTPRRRSATS